MPVSRLSRLSQPAVIYNPDQPQAWVNAYGPASIYDCEFNRINNPTTIPTNWVFQNQRSATYLETLGCGRITIPVGSGVPDNITCLVQPISPAASWTAVGAAHSKWQQGLVQEAVFGYPSGLVITDGTKAAGMLWYWTPWVSMTTWTNMAGTVAGDIGTVAVQAAGGYQMNIQYWRIRKNSSSSYDFQFSYDGMLWIPLVTAYNLGAFMTPTHFGFLFNQDTGVQEYLVDWFRVR